MSQPLARLQGVSKSFGDVCALQALDLTIPRGKLVALLGRNGAGKTTAINLMLGLLKADQGKVAIFGQGPKSLGVRQRIGAMLQHTQLPEQLTVKEHLSLFQSYFPNPLPVREIAVATQLDTLLSRRYSALSGGQKRRVLLGLALIGDPEFLLLDEPTTGLDVDTRRLLWGLVREIVDQGKTVLLTTHYLEEADALADEVAVIDEGRIIHTGTPGEVKSVFSRSVIRFKSTLTGAEVAKIAGVGEVKTSGSYYELSADKPESVLRLLLEKDSSLQDLSVTQARLEDAFLALTQSPKAA